MREQDYRLLGRLMGVARRARGLTRATVAEELGVTVAALGHWELGRRRPDDDKLALWARATEVDEAQMRRIVYTAAGFVEREDGQWSWCFDETPFDEVGYSQDPDAYDDAHFHDQARRVVADQVKRVAEELVGGVGGTATVMSYGDAMYEDEAKIAVLVPDADSVVLTVPGYSSEPENIPFGLPTAGQRRDDASQESPRVRLIRAIASLGDEDVDLLSAIVTVLRSRRENPPR